MKVKALFLLCYLIILFSCRKDREVPDYVGEYTITGKVVDEITGKGISQALVGVVERRRELSSNLGGKTLVSLRTDAEGNFSLTFNANAEENNYELVASATKYFEMTEGGDRITFTKNGKKTQNVSLLPHGYVTLQIKGNKGGKEIFISGGGGYYYSGSDTFYTRHVTPLYEWEFPYLIYYSDTSKNIKSSFKTVPPPPHDTIYHLIEF